MAFIVCEIIEDHCRDDLSTNQKRFYVYEIMLIIQIITSDSGHIQILHEIVDRSTLVFFPHKSKQTNNDY